MAQLTGIYVYPVKSARGLSLPEAALGDRGLVHDRRFLVVDEHGRFLTQRELPAMARLETALHGDTLGLRFERASVELPLWPSHGTRRRVRVFQDEVDALDLGSAVARFLSDAFARSCALVYMPEDARRAVDPSRAAAHDIVSFADAFPYLLASESSLAALNRELEQPVTMSRFRPNFVFDGLPPYAEDEFRELTIGTLPFLALKPCSRCVIVNTDPVTGVRQPGVLEALVRTHRIGNKPMFGQNLVARGSGVLRLGDPLQAGPTAR